MAIRICGICKLAFREGAPEYPVRLSEQDIEGMVGVECGGYLACGECMQAQRQRVADRGGVPVDDVPISMLF
jgi:hypothetical protein